MMTGSSGCNHVEIDAPVQNLIRPKGHKAQVSGLARPQPEIVASAVQRHQLIGLIDLGDQQSSPGIPQCGDDLTRRGETGPQLDPHADLELTERQRVHTERTTTGRGKGQVTDNSADHRVHVWQRLVLLVLLEHEMQDVRFQALVSRDADHAHGVTSDFIQPHLFELIQGVGEAQDALIGGLPQSDTHTRRNRLPLVVGVSPHLFGGVPILASDMAGKSLQTGQLVIMWLLTTRTCLDPQCVQGVLRRSLLELLALVTLGVVTHLGTFPTFDPIRLLDDEVEVRVSQVTDAQIAHDDVAAYLRLRPTVSERRQIKRLRDNHCSYLQWIFYVYSTDTKRNSAQIGRDAYAYIIPAKKTQ
ncbi:MAG TPA: hypothetical protein VK694_05305 [Verrucomicrobiae bacterium]|nr:hypothetical protein [Verrucomicrobiae bacterium]